MMIGVIGVGYWGPNLVRNLVSIGQEVLLFDQDRERLNAVAAQFSTCKQLDSLETMLSDDQVVAIVIAVPVHDHTELVVRALQAGKHVFSEKPLCLTMHECDRIEQAMNNRIVMVGHVTQFSPGINTLRTLIADGTIGELQSLSLSRTHCGPIYPKTDVLNEVAAHDAGILVSVLGTVPESVIAHGYSRLQGATVDAAWILCKWPKVVATVEVGWCSAIRKRTIVAEGSKGTLHFHVEGGDEFLDIYEQASVFEALRTAMPQRELNKIVPAKKQVPLLKSEPLFDELGEFVRCINTGRRPSTDFAFAKKIVALLSASTRSLAAEGEKIVL